MAKKININTGEGVKKAKKVWVNIGNDIVKLVYVASAWVLGSAVLSSTSTNQTKNITGYDGFSFDEETGMISYAGSSSSHSLSSLYSSGDSVYTAISSDRQTITSKRVTDETITTNYAAEWTDQTLMYTFEDDIDTYDISLEAYENYEFSEDGKFILSNPIYYDGIQGGDVVDCYSVKIGDADGATEVYHWEVSGEASDYSESELYRSVGTVVSTGTTTTYTVKTYTQTSIYQE